jgi:hypothetical protein
MLKEPEVASFRQRGTITEVVQFGMAEADHLKFTLVAEPDTCTRINYQFNECTIIISSALAREWTTTELVGFNADVDTSKCKIISILVEKILNGWMVAKKIPLGRIQILLQVNRRCWIKSGGVE